MKYSIVILIAFVLSLGLVSTTNAQNIQSSDVVNIEMVPEIPRAGESVTVFLNSYITNINSANITWRINGKTIKSGVGEKTFTFTMGGEAELTTLGISVKTTEGYVTDKSIPLRPSSVDLIWESDGFTPPFYKGKVPFSHQNKITLVAFPHIRNNSGTELNGRTLLYTWKKNGSIIENASGYGKNSYTFEGSIISRPVNITVEVNSADGVGGGYANLTLTPTEPFILMYKKDPTYGIELQKALTGQYELNDSPEISIIGMPFGFSSEDYSLKNLFFAWSINNRAVGNERSQNSQVFRKAEGVTGSSNISLKIENTNRVTQYSTNNFDLTFDKN